MAKGNDLGLIRSLVITKKKIDQGYGGGSCLALGTFFFGAGLGVTLANPPPPLLPAVTGFFRAV